MKIYRVIIRFTEDKFKDVPPTNLFLKDTRNIGKEGALKQSEAMFQKVQAENGLAGAGFKSEIFDSSEEEVEQYKLSLAKNSLKAQEMN